jgi:hypothetical protein
MMEGEEGRKREEGSGEWAGSSRKEWAASDQRHATAPPVKLQTAVSGALVEWTRSHSYQKLSQIYR